MSAEHGTAIYPYRRTGFQNEFLGEHMIDTGSDRPPVKKTKNGMTVIDTNGLGERLGGLVMEYNNLRTKGYSSEVALSLMRTAEIADLFNSAWMDRLGHEICMGIRMGLYGAGSDPSTDGIHAIADALKDDK